MNSVTPISSLTETILLILEGNDTPITAQQIEDVVSCVKTIQKRSNGLFDFVTEYRKLTKIPTPKKETIKIDELFQNLSQLWKTEFEKKNIQLNIQISENIQPIFADPHLIDQVLINLIKNSIQALDNSTKPMLTLSAKANKSKIEISVTDNGAGIPENILSDIFVPFFTTKDKGSGIGLSLSRQIMRMHGGNISVQSSPQNETIFTLTF
jgi:signal transduction histidine kinase